MESMKYFVKSVILRILFFIFGLVPKKKNWILFGSWFGQKATDSPYILYSFGCRNRADFKSFFLLKNKKLYEKLKLSGDCPNIVYSKSIKGFFVQLLCKNMVCCIDVDCDFNQYIFGKKNIFKFSHGISMKTPSEDNAVNTDARRNNRSRKIKMIYEKMNSIFFLVTSSNMVQINKNFHKWAKKFLIFGFPRYDVFFDGKSKSLDIISVNRDDFNKIFIYLPTHRQEGRVPFPLDECFDFEKLNTLMKEHNALFIIKKHFYHKNERIIDGYSNILDITNFDCELSKVIANSDVLVSDYSSTLYEFLFLNKPVIYYLFDHNDYVSNDRKSFIDFDKTLFGPTAYKFSELLDVIGQSFGSSDAYAEARLSMREYCYNADWIKPCSNDFFDMVKKLNNKKTKKEIISQVIYVE